MQRFSFEVAKATLSDTKNEMRTSILTLYIFGSIVIVRFDPKKITLVFLLGNHINSLAIIVNNLLVFNIRHERFSITEEKDVRNAHNSSVAG